MLRIVFIYAIGIILTLASCKGEPKEQLAASPSKATIPKAVEEKPAVATKTPAVEKVQVEAEKPKDLAPVEQKIEKPTPKKVTTAPVKPAPKKVTAKISQPVAKAGISFNQTVFEFGEIDEGDTVEHTFEFKNTGSAPLSIEDVSASCGCTVPSYPIMPIEPGASGKIGVLYNSKGKFGTQKPFLTIKSNATDPIVKLYLSGSIKHVFEKPAVDTSKTSG